MTRGPDVGIALVGALLAMAAREGHVVEVTAADWTAWASATFCGAHHRIVLACGDPGFRGWLSDLPEAVFAIPGHLVADIAVDSLASESGRHIATIAALTLVEA